MKVRLKKPGRTCETEAKLGTESKCWSYTKDSYYGLTTNDNRLEII
jgi:hypothetical protein|tara:strand:- start:1158 stop:1295 length:138 start_codon:yes stop_codon:yes gene_type:complete